MTKTDPTLQAQVDAQLMEQGAFTALELLIDSGRLTYGDYEAWRRREIEFLDSMLMGSREKIRAQVEQAAGYARGIGLAEQTQEFQAWKTRTSSPDEKPLRISADAQFHRLLAGRFTPAQSIPQMDLFFDNPVVALTNGIVRALSARNPDEARRQLDRLYAQAPNHADLAAFDKLLAALERLEHAVEDPRQELDSLLEIAPLAKRLLGSQSRDLLTPLWRQLAAALGLRQFAAEEPNLHRSFALGQAQDWPGVSACVRSEPGWWLHAALCLRMAQSSFYQQQRSDALTAWCHLCWRHPEQASTILERGQHPDAGVTALWQRFLDSEDDDATEEDASPAPAAADFPAWLLLHEPGLAQQLAVDLPTGNSPAEEHYRCVHRWIQARRAGRAAEEMALRKTLQASHPALFRRLKASV